MVVSAAAGAPVGAVAASAGGCWFWKESKFWNDISDMEVFEKDRLIQPKYECRNEEQPRYRNLYGGNPGQHCKTLCPMIPAIVGSETEERGSLGREKHSRSI